MNPIKQYKSVPVKEETELSSVGVRVLYEDSKGNVWIGTSNKGLYFIEQGKDELVRCKLKGIDSGIGPTGIFDIFEDSEGTLWIAANGSLYLRKNHFPLSVFDNFNRESSVNISTTCSIYEDRYGWLWIGTYNQGLFCRPIEFNESDTLLNFTHEPWNNKSLSNERVWATVEDANGDLWFATENGLNKFIREEETFERFISETDRGANCIWDMTADNKGYLWMTTESGLFRYKPNTSGTGQTDNYEIKKILPFRDIFLKNIDKTPDGKIYIGGADFTGNGYFSFHPDSITENKQIPPVYVTEFNVRNEQFGLDTSIILKKHIILNYNQNFFSFKFAALDYINPKMNHYAYYLDGLEDDWIYSGNRRLANYTGVLPGDYIFKVKGSNNDGYWNEEGVNITITILPPPWKTWWAYFLYGLFIVSIIYIILRYYLKRQQLLHQLALEHIEYDKLEELNRIKSRFFANISHEFRTPLTLILGPLQKLFSKTSNEETKQELNIMQRNARRLQNLINQLLDLSKLESGKTELIAREENIVGLVKSYVQQFESMAKQKKINLVFTSEKDVIHAYVDREKIEHLLYNLLSNAFKFTGEGGEITVSVGSQQSTSGSTLTEDSITDWIQIIIYDTGRGISPEGLNRVFDRFYQADDLYTKEQEGTGIGLALAKELVELHHGTIEVESEVGRETKFTVLLPVGKDHLNPEEIEDAGESKKEKGKETGSLQLEVGNGIMHNEQSIENQRLPVENDNPIILIVEDNTDMRLYIRAYLEQSYRIIEAEDGQKGFKLAMDNIPDLIISDVMMPKMDGIELCRKIKEDVRTSHIPLILLTAKTSVENKLEGLETGADDYLYKPFNHHELIIRVHNMIERQKKIREHFVKEFGLRTQFIPVADEVSYSSMDEQFLLKTKNTIEENMTNPDLSVDKLATMVGMSSSQLHRKLTAITNLSPSGLIKSLRLNRAAQHLKQKSGTVSEIAFDVGFNNLSYFSKSFQEQFGILPSEYGDRNERE